MSGIGARFRSGTVAEVDIDGDGWRDEPEVGAVPLLEDLPALFGLVPLVPEPAADNAANDGTPAPGERAPRRRGRHPKPEHAATVPFSVRLTAEERALVYRAAMGRPPGTSVAAWARAALVGVARGLLEPDAGGSDAAEAER